MYLFHPEAREDSLLNGSFQTLVLGQQLLERPRDISDERLGRVVEQGGVLVAGGNLAHQDAVLSDRVEAVGLAGIPAGVREAVRYVFDGEVRRGRIEKVEPGAASEPDPRSCANGDCNCVMAHRSAHSVGAAVVKGLARAIS